VKVTVVAPEATATDAGRESDALLLEIATPPPPVLDRVTVQVLEPALVTVEGLQTSDVIVTGVLSVSEVDRDDPFSMAVMVADWSVVTTLRVARNVAAVALGGTDTDAGTVTEV